MHRVLAGDGCDRLRTVAPLPGEAAPGHPRWAPAGRRERKRASFSRAWQLQSAKVEAALSLHRPARQPVATLIRERPEIAQTLSQFTNWFGRNNKPVPCVDPRLQLFAGLYDVVMHINYQRWYVSGVERDGIKSDRSISI